MAEKMKRAARRAAWLLIAALAWNLSGCASVQKKFTRKPKQPKHVAKAIAFEQGPYQKKFSNEYYYKTHYTYWKAWQGEWIDGLGGNRKKTARNATEALSHLKQMKDYLKPEKAKELDEPYTLLMRMQEQMETGQYSSSGTTKVELDKWRRLISSNFYYEKVKDDLLPDTVDLGTEPAATPVPGGQEPAPVQ